MRKYLLCFSILLPWVSFADMSKRSITMAAVGDSISTGLNAIKWGNQSKQYSWSTGNNSLIKSHYSYLTNEYGKEVEYFNVAKSGSSSKGLLKQIEKLSNKDIDYITFMIGANDICNVDRGEEFDIDSFSDNINKAVSKTVLEHPDVIINLLPVPDLYHLWKVAQDKGSCQFKWSFFGICPRLLSTKSSEEDRQSVIDDIILANGVLAQIAADYYENISFTPFSKDIFSWKDISRLDCFHPSVSGQNLISQHSLPDLIGRL